MVDDFTRIINPLKVRLGKTYGNVYVKIVYRDGKLSITGVEAPLPSGNCRGACGQIGMDWDKKREVKYNYGWNATKWNKLLYIWEKFHLNDLHAGTPKQEEALRKKFGGVNANKYDEQVAYLKSINLYEDEGYKFGTAWLKIGVPEPVLEWLKNLENTKNQPAWV